MTKTINIVVNGRQVQVEKDELSFSELVTLACGTSTASENTIFTITYKRGHGNKPEGPLIAGETVKVKEGMVFNVTKTDKS